jgi:hypothetical protein
MKFLTSYKDDKNQEAKQLLFVGSGTKAGMQNCAKETREYAKDPSEDAKETREYALRKDPNPPPENTRSNSADRIKRYRESISWSIADRENEVRNSPLFMETAKFLIQCVLSSVYGENVRIETIRVDELKKDKSRPGRAHFVDNVLDALDMGKDSIKFLRKRDGKLIGLLSRSGPIPIIENTFELPELEFAEGDFDSLIRGLDKIDKQILKYWLDNNPKEMKEDCKLYKEILKIFESEKISVDTVVTNALSIDIDEPAKFPVLKEYSEAVLLDKIMFVPVIDKKQRFGYDMPKEPTGENPLYIEVDGICYAVLPPFTDDTIKDINKEQAANDNETAKRPKFFIESIKITDSDLKENNKLSSLTIQCQLRNNGLIQIVRKTYSDQQMRFVKYFPSLSVYGPVPQYGWIVRRDFDPKTDIPSPLASSTEDETFELKDILFFGIKEDIKFEDIRENYTVYSGEIPQWLGVYTKTGDWLGALPVRMGQAEKPSLNTPNFILKEKPNGKIIVSVDVGSSRSAVLFQKVGHTDVDKEIFAEKWQSLSVKLTTLGTVQQDVDFAAMCFLEENRADTVSGKIPMGLLTTNEYRDKGKDDILLYRSGKLLLLDPESITKASTREILSDVKAGADPKAMRLLAQGMLSMIIDRAIHLECSEIELRLAYLIERYTPLKMAWEASIKKFQSLFPNIKIELKMYLPESLAIANHLKALGNFDTVSGAAIIDIGDFTTDFALFKKIGNQIKLIGNESVLFAGRQIIIQPIWDYLQISGIKNVKSLFNIEAQGSKEAVERLEKQVENAKKAKKEAVPEDVRRDILCLMANFKRDTIPCTLQNLFDICYLTEILLLKCLIRQYPNDFPEDEDGYFDIRLFGGGSSLMKEESGSFSWKNVLHRGCTIDKRSSSNGNMLASGLIDDIQNDLIDAAKNMKKQAEDHYELSNSNVVNTEEIKGELRGGYIRFLKNAQAVKKWEVLDKNDNNVSPGKLFNVKKPHPDADGVINDNELFNRYYSKALEYATSGSVTDKEIIKTLFAYKIAYSSAINFYSRGRE